MSRIGAALIEMLIALVILASAGVSTIGFVAAVVDDRLRTEKREIEVVAAERVLKVHALLKRSGLEQRLGDREVAGHIVRVERPLPSLFRISVRSVPRPEVELVVTVVHRAESGRDE